MSRLKLPRLVRLHEESHIVFRLHADISKGFQLALPLHEAPSCSRDEKGEISPELRAFHAHLALRIAETFQTLAQDEIIAYGINREMPTLASAGHKVWGLVFSHLREHLNAEATLSEAQKRAVYDVYRFSYKDTLDDYRHYAHTVFFEIGNFDGDDKASALKLTTLYTTPLRQHGKLAERFNADPHHTVHSLEGNEELFCGERLS